MEAWAQCHLYGMKVRTEIWGSTHETHVWLLWHIFKYLCSGYTSIYSYLHVWAATMVWHMCPCMYLHMEVQG